MNSRIRESGYSSTEIWTKRDMNTGESLSITDEGLANQKYNQRLSKHTPSAVYKGRGRTEEKVVEVKVGDLVYLYSDRDKTKARSKYMITEVLDDQQCVVQKFTAGLFKSKKYKVRRSDLIKVLQHANSVSDSDNCAESADEVGAARSDESVADPQSESSAEEDRQTTEGDTSEVEEQPPVRRSARTRRRPPHLEDYVEMSSGSDD